jgi:hypothetical protein
VVGGRAAPTAPGNRVTVAHYVGVGFFAELPRMRDLWPERDDATKALIVLSLRTVPDVASTGLLTMLVRFQVRSPPRATVSSWPGSPTST